MIDIGWTELFFMAVILIVVVGPKDLPAVLRTLGRMMRKVRSLADEFRQGLDDFMREAEMNELNENVERMRNFNLKDLEAHGRKKSAKSDAPLPTDPPPAPAKPSSETPNEEGDTVASESPAPASSSAETEKDT